MAEKAKGPGGHRKKKRQSHPGKRGLRESLEQAHDADHAILESLGIKHPHVPLLSVVEMLDHLRDHHKDESNE